MPTGFRHRLGRLFVSVVVLGLVEVSLLAQDKPETGFWHTSQLTGDWGGARSNLEERGVRVSLFVAHTFGSMDPGSALPSLGRHSDSVDVFGQFDFDTMNAIRGGEALVQLKSNWGQNINPEAGALGDPIDDADGNHALYVNQLWYQQSTPGRTFQVRFGYLDQQVILDRNAFANSEDRQFMSTFLDNNNAIIPLAIGPGVALFYNAADWLSFVVTASDAKAQPRTFSFATAFDGEYFTYFETDFRTRLGAADGPLIGNYRIGYFVDPRDKTIFGSDEVDTQSHGAYLSLDQVVYAEPTGDDQGLGLFFRYGWRPAATSQVTRFWSGGAQYKGLFPGGDQHTLGLAFYSAIGSDLYRRHVDPAFDSETAYEAYYAFQISPAISLTPAFQYVNQPGALTVRERAVVFALRGRVSL